MARLRPAHSGRHRAPTVAERHRHAAPPPKPATRVATPLLLSPRHATAMSPLLRLDYDTVEDSEFYPEVPHLPFADQGKSQPPF
ncbi:hypothetical protein GUJ93_ZPchr0007g5975 [Zizania palustris]|uniref:Uncharacterized protein n=1 Tax=Zizania palustris TaxID=103762 RepID=A0A8J5VUG1_ZIZPA|nr:hypothetical protein GUJ93_ZPchr0007g5975 [Zizania palustris]